MRKIELSLGSVRNVEISFIWMKNSGTKVRVDLCDLVAYVKLAITNEGEREVKTMKWLVRRIRGTTKRIKRRLSRTTIKEARQNDMIEYNHQLAKE